MVVVVAVPIVNVSLSAAATIETVPKLVAAAKLMAENVQTGADAYATLKVTMAVLPLATVPVVNDPLVSVLPATIAGVPAVPVTTGAVACTWVM